MTDTTARAATVATLTLTALLAAAPMLATSATAADDGGSSTSRSKAAIEHDEWVAAAAPSTKAQIEHEETASRDAGTTGSPADRSTSSQTATGGGDAAAWQLAASAALGAVITGAAFVGARQVSMHRAAGQAVAR